MSATRKHSAAQKNGSGKLNPTDFKLLPFSPKEAKAIKVWLRKSRAGQQANGATLVDKYWREILESVG